jgi:hypothetical protein
MDKQIKGIPNKHNLGVNYDGENKVWWLLGMIGGNRARYKYLYPKFTGKDNGKILYFCRPTAAFFLYLII